MALATAAAVAVAPPALKGIAAATPVAVGLYAVQKWMQQLPADCLARIVDVLFSLVRSPSSMRLAARPDFFLCFGL